MTGPAFQKKILILGSSTKICVWGNFLGNRH